MPNYWPDGRCRLSHNDLPVAFPDLSKWDWPALKYLLQEVYQWVLVDHLAEQPWFGDAIADRDVAVGLRPLEGLQGLTVKFPKRIARLQESRQVWGEAATPRLARSLARLFDYCDVGVWAWPSTLGLEMMRRDFPAEIPPQPSPRGECWQTLQESMTGGRVDTIRSNETFAEATELDLNMAYAAAICDVPAGFPRRTYMKSDGYCHWNWRIKGELPLGPLHVRGSDGRLSYPTSGEGNGWYWDIEIEQAEQLGVECVPDYGWAWEKRTNAWSGWAEHMWRLRTEAPRGDLADHIKHVTVAAIGALGRTGAYGSLVRLAAKPAAEPLFSPFKGFSNEWGVEYGEPKPGSMIHIASYVRAKVRTWLFAKALPYAISGRLISTDYDAIRVAGREPVKRDKSMGAWKGKILHNVMVSKARWIESEEKTRTPGKTRSFV